MLRLMKGGKEMAELLKTLLEPLEEINAYKTVDEDIEREKFPVHISRLYRYAEVSSDIWTITFRALESYYCFK